MRSWWHDPRRASDQVARAVEPDRERRRRTQPRVLRPGLRHLPAGGLRADGCAALRPPAGRRRATTTTAAGRAPRSSTVAAAAPSTTPSRCGSSAACTGWCSTGAAPELAEFYPSAGGHSTGDPVPAFLAVLDAHRPELEAPDAAGRADERGRPGGVAGPRFRAGRPPQRPAAASAGGGQLGRPPPALGPLPVRGRRGRARGCGQPAGVRRRLPPAGPGPVRPGDGGRSPGMRHRADRRHHGGRPAHAAVVRVARSGSPASNGCGRRSIWPGRTRSPSTVPTPATGCRSRSGSSRQARPPSCSTRSSCSTCRDDSRRAHEGRVARGGRARDRGDAADVVADGTSRRRSTPTSA